VAIKVGAALSLSGGFALQGRQAARGLRLWAEDVERAGGVAVRDRDGRLPVEMVIYDDESRTGLAAARVEKLIAEDRVDLLIGPYSSALTMAAAPVADRYRKVLWNHGGASDAIARRNFRFVVGLASPASQYFVGILRMLMHVAPSATRVAFVYGARGTFPPAVIAGAERYARDNGMRVILKAPYPPAREGLAALGAQLTTQSPDVILGVGRMEEDVQFARTLKAQRVRARAMGVVAAPLREFAAALGRDTHGFLGPSQWEPGARYRPDVGPAPAEFVARFRDRFGGEPDYPAVQAYAAGLVAQRCVEAAGTLRDGPVREEADKLDFTTLYGRFKLAAPAGEQIGHSMVIVQWQDDRKPIVWPPEVAEAQPEL
jgi:branched-chain amino acid transport system substrate-binding protein